jgi:hypothetical protein
MSPSSPKRLRNFVVPTIPRHVQNKISRTGRCPGATGGRGPPHGVSKGLLGPLPARSRLAGLPGNPGSPESSRLTADRSPSARRADRPSDWCAAPVVADLPPPAPPGSSRAPAGSWQAPWDLLAAAGTTPLNRQAAHQRQPQIDRSGSTTCTRRRRGCSRPRHAGQRPSRRSRGRVGSGSRHSPQNSLGVAGAVRCSSASVAAAVAAAAIRRAAVACLFMTGPRSPARGRRRYEPAR